MLVDSSTEVNKRHIYNITLFGHVPLIIIRIALRDAEYMAIKQIWLRQYVLLISMFEYKYRWSLFENANLNTFSHKNEDIIGIPAVIIYIK